MYEPTLPPFVLLAPYQANQAIAAFDEHVLHEWIDWVHPLGYKYYSCPQLRLLTTLDPRAPDVAPLLLHHAAELSQNWAAAAHTWIVILSMEDDVVRYYMIDYATRSTFWVHEMPWAGLRFAQQRDPDRFQSNIRPYFWAHVEQYPEVTPVDVGAEAAQLTTMLLLSQIPGSDHLTPFSRETCGQLIDALQAAQVVTGGGYGMTSVARLWKEISEHQHRYRYEGRTLRARFREFGPLAFVERRPRVPFGWLDWLGHIVPQPLAGLSIYELCFCLYSALLLVMSECLSRGRSPESRPLSLGLATLAIDLPLIIFFPAIQDHIETMGFGVRRAHGRLISGLLAFNFGIYLALLNHLCTALGSPESAPSTGNLIVALSVLVLPLGIPFAQ